MKKWEERIESMTPEQIKGTCKNLLLQNQQLVEALNQERNKTFFKRMDYLFKVVELGLFPDDFTQACMEELQSNLTIPTEVVEEEKPEE